MSYYVMPIGGTGTRSDPFVPKYLANLKSGWQWRELPRGWAVVYDPTADAAEDTAIGANADAIVIPPLDNTVAVNATKNALEALSIPAQWVISGMTYRTVLRTIVGMANFAQRCEGINPSARLSLTGNLDKTFSQLPAATRSVLTTASDSLGLDRSGVTGATTLREILRILAQQIIANWPTWPSGGSIALGDL
jgi:hypothetical protein